jgi:hypothetical protein
MSILESKHNLSIISRDKNKVSRKENMADSFVKYINTSHTAGS